jgi:phenylalanyl-tRNA synthetase beta chain
VLTGARAPLHWSGPAGDYELWDLKGLVEQIADLVDVTLSVDSPSGELRGVSPLFEPDTVSALMRGDRLVGLAGAIRPQAIDAPAWAAQSFGFEVLLESSTKVREHEYQALPLLPAIEQDLALLVPNAVSAAQVEALIRAAGGDLLEQVMPFDLYRGAGIPEGTRSIAYRLRFRAPDRTLTDAEAAAMVQRILKRLRDDHGIERRG